MITLRELLLSAFIATLPACASWHPTPVEDPTQAQLNEIAKDALRPPISPYTAAIRVHQLHIYYQNESDRLKKYDNWSQEGTFAGAIIAAGAGLAEAVDVAAAGIALAGGSSVVSAHYAFDVQSTNYKRASRALHCMFLPLWNAAHLKLPVYMPKVNAQIDDVVHRLKDAQAEIALVTPDVESLQQSLGVMNTAELAAKNANIAASNALATISEQDMQDNMEGLKGNQVSTFSTIPANALNTQQIEELTRELYANLKVCADTF